MRCSLLYLMIIPTMRMFLRRLQLSIQAPIRYPILERTAIHTNVISFTMIININVSE